MDSILSFLQGFSIALIFAMWFLTIKEYKKLPKFIPTHFDGQGLADASGPKYFIFLLPIIASVLYVFLGNPTGFGHYPVTITPENEPVQLMIGKLAVGSIFAYIFMLFFWMVKQIIKIALGKGQMQPAKMFFWIGGLLVVIIFFIILSHIFK